MTPSYRPLSTYRDFFFSSRRRHTCCLSDWSSDVCSSDLVAYGSDPNKVLAILVETARAHGEVLSLPEPQAFFTKFQDSALAFQLRIWCRFELALRVKSEEIGRASCRKRGWTGRWPKAQSK